MPNYEYHVVPAPKKAGKIKGVKGTENRFAAELARVMNELGADGWEYQRTDTLPVEERQGLTGRTTTFQNMLVFRRTLSTMEEPQITTGALDDAEIINTADSVEAEPAATFSHSSPVEIATETSEQNSAPTINAHIEPSEGDAPRIFADRNQDSQPQA